MDISEEACDRFGRGVVVSEQVGDEGLVGVWFYVCSHLLTSPWTVGEGGW